MPINLLVIDPEDVLFSRQEEQQHLNAFLQSLGIEPRHPQIVEKALKAARFDVLHGRITRDTYYNAILRFHGVPEGAAYAIGRQAILADTTNLVPVAGAAEALQQIYAAGIALGLVVNSEHSAIDFINVLGDIGYIRSIWSYAVSSSEVGYMIPDPAIFEAIIESPKSTAVLSAKPIPWLLQTDVTSLVYGAYRQELGFQSIFSPEELVLALVS